MSSSFFTDVLSATQSNHLIIFERPADCSGNSSAALLHVTIDYLTRMLPLTLMWFAKHDVDKIPHVLAVKSFKWSIQMSFRSSLFVTSILLCCNFNSVQAQIDMSFEFVSIDAKAEMLLVRYNMEVVLPYQERVLQHYSIQVPYTETVGGKEVRRERTEIRSRVVAVPRTRTEARTRSAPLTHYKFEFLSGKKPSTAQLADFLKKPRLVLILNDKQRVTDIHRGLLKSDMLVMTEVNRND